MRKGLLRFLTRAFSMLIFTCCAAAAASGPQTAWNVLTLPIPMKVAPSPTRSSVES
jgi:hypothetical protein